MEKISLVIASKGRVEACENLLYSLCAQQVSNFEIIIVDQSPTENLRSLVDKDFFSNLEIIYVPSNEFGASRGRNAGIKFARGAIIGFPDDDCWYHPDLLSTVHQGFIDHPETACLCGRLLDENNLPHSRKMNTKSKSLHLTDMFYYPSETVIFLRKIALGNTGDFDPLIGTGAKTVWGAGEATDLTIRVVKAGFVIRYEPELKIFHRLDAITLTPSSLKKAQSYATGMGAVARKNNLNLFQIVYLLFFYIRPIAFALLMGKFSSAKYHYSRAKGFLQGWRTYPQG